MLEVILPMLPVHDTPPPHGQAGACACKTSKRACGPVYRRVRFCAPLFSVKPVMARCGCEEYLRKCDECRFLEAQCRRLDMQSSLLEEQAAAMEACIAVQASVSKPSTSSPAAIHYPALNKHKEDKKKAIQAVKLFFRSLDRGFAKGVAGTVSLPIFSVFFRFLPFFSVSF